LYAKKILKKENNINIDTTTICVLFLSIRDTSLTGRNPPDEINVNAKFNESKDLIENKFKIIKIKRVKPEYNKKILVACLNISELLKEIKFVNDFLKLSS
jgi:hypothetical protein